MMFATGFSQTLKTSVFSTGGGVMENTSYRCFGTFGQPLTGHLSSSRFSVYEGFIFAQQNIITATITADETICYNTAASVLNSAYTGAEGDVTYQWQVLNGTTWEDITWATGESYDPDSLTETSRFRLMADDISGIGQVVSDTVTVTVYEAFTAGAIKNEGDTICYGGDPGNIGCDSPASGGVGRIAYRWQSSTDNITFGTIVTGATNASYDPPSGLTQTTWYRRQAMDSTCHSTFDHAAGVWKVLVFPTTSGGAVTGGTQVCYGNNSTVLTLSGQTGVVTKWQYNTGSSGWSDISGHTATTYTAVNVTDDTWYRAVVQNGVCSAIPSDSTQITLITGMTISGIAKYHNNPKTPLNGLKIILKQGSSAIDSVNTNTAGYYSFNGLSSGTYGLEIKSAHPSGQWQTWGGVTNSDYLLVSQHVAGSNLLQADPPVVRVTASVKVPHPLINSLDASTIRQAVKYPVTGWNYFDIPKWVFSGVSSAARIDSVVVNCDDVIRDIRGLCAGDVNGSFVPGNGYKVSGSGLELATLGTIPAKNEMTFGVRLVETSVIATHPVETHGSASHQNAETHPIETHGSASLQSGAQPIGAITLFMNYNPTLVKITNVTMPMNSGTDPWFETNNGELYIGWVSTEPIPVVENQTVILVHARLLAPVETHGSASPDPDETHHRASLQPTTTPIRFTLNETMVSELADGGGNVIEGVKLAMPGAGENGETVKWQNGETAKRQNGKIVCYPNPAQSTLNIELSTPNLQLATCNSSTSTA